MASDTSLGRSRRGPSIAGASLGSLPSAFTSICALHEIERSARAAQGVYRSLYDPLNPTGCQFSYLGLIGASALMNASSLDQTVYRFVDGNTATSLRFVRITNGGTCDLLIQ